MNYDNNPFQELYVSDDLADEFVELFSPVPLQSAINPVFQDGNVVLSGTQGCGKSMILRLLVPETRIAYHDAKKKFPLQPEHCRFISAGANLTRSGLCDIAQVTIGAGEAGDLTQLPFFFADFFNHWVVEDLLKNVRKIAARPEVFGELCNYGQTHRRDFVHCLIRQDCWLGALDGCSSLEAIEKRISGKIASYRRWISTGILDTTLLAKLTSERTIIGEPIARTVKCLKESGIVAEKTRVFIRVDQLEELHQSVTGYQQALRMGFRRLINRAIGARDRRIHYRIGTRRYGWNRPELLVVHGSGARLENRRDFLHIDMDEELFLRKEHDRGVFPKFAGHAFELRLRRAFCDTCPSKNDLAKVAFGVSPKPKELAEKIVRSEQSPARVEHDLALDDPIETRERWSPEWRSWLFGLYAENPLNAVLAAAWGRQTAGKGGREHRDNPPPRDGSWLKPWWRKERLKHAILHLAARRAQRLLWSGYEDIISLSGGNITAYLQLCHKTWDLFLRREGLNEPGKRINPLSGATPIPERLQAAGIQSASADWYEKIREQPGGDVRQRFIEHLGKFLRQQLRKDNRMSYPGANGFSLALADLEADKSPNREVWRFLSDAVGYGDLHAVRHTTKNKAGEARIKFYLNPILSPAFQLPAIHTKEPLYWSVNRVAKLAEEAKVIFPISQQSDDPAQLRLFSEP